MSKLNIVVAATAVAAFANRSAADVVASGAVTKVLEAGDQYGFGTSSSPTIFKVDGEKVKAYANKEGAITLTFTGTHAEAPKNAPIEI